MKTQFAVTAGVGSSLANKTGAWRTERPVYVNRLAPCGNACPAGEDVQGWLYHAEAGDYEAAWRRIMTENPFPAIMGRACYHPCETACNRAQLDAHVGINSVERFIGDLAIERGWTVAPAAKQTGKRVLVIGAGPSGLSAAYHLRCLGHDVVVRDAGAQPGGMMRYGIPAYRLPRDVIDAEVDRVAAMGVTFEMGRPVVALDTILASREFDAVFLAVGAQVSHHVDIPAGDSARILDAISVLRVAGEEPPLLGRQVAVYGGGNTALDTARTALRLGATDATVVYRRTRERMPAHETEYEDAVAEGVRFHWLSTVTKAAGGKLTIEKMALDSKGFPQPTGEFEELDADSLLLAVGQDADLALLEGVKGITVKDGVVEVDQRMMTGHAGLFAGGDMTPGDRTITTAVGHGKTAARHISAWLHGETYAPAPPAELATFDKLNTWYYSDAPKTIRPQLDAARRTGTFDEVVMGLDAATALFEARRCFSCGNCFECDNCYGVCPDNAVVKLAPGEKYAFNLDYCKGCGVCAEECPCGAIVMEPEQI